MIYHLDGHMEHPQSNHPSHRGKTNGNAIDLSTIADANNPTGGFVINGEIKYDYSGFSVSNAGDVNGEGCLHQQ
jgi:hypothetical protein